MERRLSILFIFMLMFQTISGGFGGIVASANAEASQVGENVLTLESDGTDNAPLDGTDNDLSEEDATDGNESEGGSDNDPSDGEDNDLESGSDNDSSDGEDNESEGGSDNDPSDEGEGDAGATENLENDTEATPESDADPVSWDEVEIEHVDAAGNPVTESFQIDSHVKVKFHYSIVDGIQVDTSKIYGFTIPGEIKIIADLELQLLDGDRLLANVFVKMNGTMTVQFLEEINNEDFDEKRAGWVTVSSQFDETKLGDGGDKTISFEYDGKSKDITVNFDEIVETGNVTLEKKGSYDTTNNEITWTITVKPTTEPKGRTIENINITDIIEGGQTYIPGSAKLNGSDFEPEPVTGNILKHEFPELEDGANQTITFKTKADLSEFVTHGDEIEFKNTATGTFGKDNTPTNNAEDTVETEVNFIIKSGREIGKVEEGEGNPKPKIEWTIKINNNNLELPTGVKVTDTLGEYLEYDEGSLVISPEIDHSFTKSDDGKTLTITFNEKMEEMHTITYTTTVTDPDAYKSNDKKTYNNKAEINWADKPDGGTITEEIGVGVSTSVISKSGAGYNAATHEVTWKITVNSNKIKITNPVVTDLLPKELEIVKEKTTLPEGWVLTDPIEMKDERQNLEFKYTGEISDTYTFTLVTKIKDEHKKYFGDNSTENIENTVELTGEGINKSEDPANQEIVSKVIQKSAKGYDYVTRKAKWEIVVNQNKMPITNAVVTDVIQGEFHEFVGGSLKIGDDDVTLITEEFTEANQYKVDGKTITINLGNITEEKTITFETQIPEDKVDEFFKTNNDKQLKNNSALTGNEIHESVGSDATQKVENTVVSKTGQYTNGNDFIDWLVVVNSNELELTDVSLEDTLQEGLILDTLSPTLSKLTINSNGTYIVGDPKPLESTIDTETNTVTFNLGNIEDAYILKFRTDVDDAFNTKKFSNTIKLSGSNGEQTGTSTNIQVAFQTGDAGGSGTSTRGSLIVNKVNKEDPNNILPLEGAKFELYKSDKTTLVDTSEETGADGAVLFDNLRMGTYYIKEIKAPEGYVIDSSLKEVKLEKGLDTKHITYDFVNERIKGNVELIKVDQNDNTLQGAEFGIFATTDTGFKTPLQTETSNEDGLVKFEGIEYGDYLVKETKAPRGYKLSHKTIEVEIKQNNQTITLDNVVNTKITGSTPLIGSIQLVKKDNEGNLLPGVGFTLYAESDKDFKNPIDTKYSNSEGLVEFKDVVYGKYVIKETNTPVEYVPSNEAFTVEVKESGKVVVLEDVINTRVRANIELTKKNNEGDLLTGVEFTIYKKSDKEFNNAVQSQISDGNGLVRFENIPVGKYVIKETRELAGYVKSEKYIDVALTQESHGKTIKLDDVINKKIRGSIEIFKREKDDHKALIGAEIAVYTEKDVLIAKKATGENGIVIFEGLEYGNYYYKEVKAPLGYVLDDSEHPFVIDTDGVKLKRNLDNAIKPIGPEMPEKPVDPEDPDKPVIDPTEPVTPEDPDNDEVLGEGGEKEDPDKPVVNPSKPTKPTNPGSPDDPNSDVLGDGGKLPKTATNIFNLLLTGFGLLTAGLLLQFIRRRKEA